ncbi:MAG: Lon protease-like protein [Pseudohongiellaceae bacterium]|jgi:Lon protease-like protein
MTSISIFPIPNCVCFPGTIFPLHVFEPRYRAMIKHCLDTGQLLAIAHTQKVVSESRSNGSLEEALKTNQTTYKPFPIFSAGSCELLEELEDGRMYLQIHMQSRFTAVKEIQTLPYSVFECELVEDEVLSAADEIDLAQLQQKILNRLLVITADSPDVHAILSSSAWTAKKSIDFSFEVFTLLQFDADVQQQILEMTSPQARLMYLLTLLNSR